MLEILRASDPSASERLDAILSRRRADDTAVSVSDIIESVRTTGDAALLDFTTRFDHVDLDASRLRVSPDEIAAATVDPRTDAAMRRAIERIDTFHRNEQRDDWWSVSPDGAVLGQRIVPIDSVGIYVPGGAAPYASSLLMNVIPARIAGVRRIVAVTPPGRDGAIDESILVAARLCGVHELYRVGGAQAIAALAYGTSSIVRVDKIVGPGNAYVATAKRLVYGLVGIDTIAGPSEVVVLADGSADPRFIAADLAAQAEHGGAFVVLVTTSSDLVSAVVAELERSIPMLERAETIRSALSKGLAIVAGSLDEAIDCAERIAPEHLELHIEDPLPVAKSVRTAGVVLCGAYGPAAICDYGLGPNHVLPTGGTARFSSALGVDDFTRRMSIAYPTQEAFADVAPDGIALAEAERLTAHAAALRIRSEVNR